MKDERPNLQELFVDVLKSTAKEDLFASSTSISKLYTENKTFCMRTIKNFIIVSMQYYKPNEIEKWLDNNILNNQKLPDINKL